MNYRTRIYEVYASTFKNASEKFDAQAAEHWGRSQEYFLRGWLPPSKNAPIADLACGGGNLLYFFKTSGYTNLSGVDISHEQVNLAKQVTPNVDEGDVLHWLENHPNSFDLLTGYDIIEHLTKDEVLQLLDACHRALKPRGRLVLQTPNAETPFSSSIRYGDFTHEVAFTPNALGGLLSLTGFSDIEPRETNPVPFGYSLKSSARYLAWQVIRANLQLWNLAETGSRGSGVFTRVFLISALKP